MTDATEAWNTLNAAARTHTDALSKAAVARANLDAAIAAAVEVGFSEVRVARAAHLDRLTVRRVLGKDDRKGSTLSESLGRLS